MHKRGSHMRGASSQGRPGLTHSPSPSPSSFPPFHLTLDNTCHAWRSHPRCIFTGNTGPFPFPFAFPFAFPWLIPILSVGSSPALSSHPHPPLAHGPIQPEVISVPRASSMEKSHHEKSTPEEDRWTVISPFGDSTSLVKKLRGITSQKLSSNLGVASYMDINGYSYKRDVLFCYDLKLPEGFTPNNQVHTSPEPVVGSSFRTCFCIYGLLVSRCFYAREVENEG